jgi:hypothetical protein
MEIGVRELLSSMTELEQNIKFARPGAVRRALSIFDLNSPENMVGTLSMSSVSRNSGKEADKSEVEELLFREYEGIRFAFENLDRSERVALLESIEIEVNGSEFKQSGPQRIADWNSGWGENLDSLRQASKSMEDSETFDISPKYFRKYKFERIGGVHVRPLLEEGVEYRALSLVVDAMVVLAMRVTDAEEIWEFGAGTGHHLSRLRKLFPTTRRVGLDWANSSQDLIREVSLLTADKYLEAENFDYYTPDFSKTPNKPAVYLTVASLEQIGSNHSAWLEYVLQSKPKVVVHIEPIGELLGDSQEELLSKRYFQKRAYLSGYLTSLLELEAEGKAQLHYAERTGLGSYFIEGYSVCIWSPLEE